MSCRAGGVVLKHGDERLSAVHFPSFAADVFLVHLLDYALIAMPTRGSLVLKPAPKIRWSVPGGSYEVNSPPVKWSVLKIKAASRIFASLAPGARSSSHFGLAS